MKNTIVLGSTCALLLLGMGAAGDVQAQRAPWWERQKAAQAASQATSGESAARQGNTTQPAVQQPQYHAPAATPEKAEGPSHTYLEVGATRADVDLYDVNENGNGGYLRGSLQVTDNGYLFGGYSRAARSWGNVDGERLEVDIDQAELGWGYRHAFAPGTDFISELSLVRLGASSTWGDLDGSDHVYAGKLMLGVRGVAGRHFDYWAKAGYLRVDDNLLVDHSVVGNLGMQYRFSPGWGLVGEAEFYEDVRFYRLGVRASF